MVHKRAFTGRNGIVQALIAGLTLLLSLLAWPSGATPLGVTVAVPALSSSTNSDPSLPNFAISGPGYFVVRDPLTGQLNATRLGFFMLDANGYVVTSGGMKVQGFNDPALTNIGDLQVENMPEQGTTPSPSLILWQVQSNGTIVASYSDNSSMVRGQILLQNFQNPAALSNQGNWCFSWSATAVALTQPVPPGSAGTGFLTNGLEQFAPKLQLGVYTGPPASFSQGILVSTGVPTDIGVEGAGFFVLRRTNDNALFATRAGAFYLDGSGYLVHYSGMRLQGYVDAALTTVGDVQINADNLPAGSQSGSLMESFSIDRRGDITLSLNDGTFFVRGQILLQNCASPDSLTRSNFDLYPMAANPGLWSPIASPLTGNLGWLVSGMVELSQFDTNLLAVRSHLNFFSQGEIEVVNIPSSLAIVGPGFFTVRDPVSNAFYATRYGDFHLDAVGYLVTTSGLRLQGLTNPSLSETGDIKIDWEGDPESNAELQSYSIDGQGNIQVTQTDGSVFVRGRILLQNYRNLQALVPVDYGLYSNLTAALPMFTNGLSGYVSLGVIQSDALELLPNSPPALQLLPSSGMRLFISDLNAGDVQSSSDMVHWDVIGQVSGSDLNVAEFFDTPQATQKFYRVVVDY